jgi:hypothetical protein
MMGSIFHLVIGLCHPIVLSPSGQGQAELGASLKNGCTCLFVSIWSVGSNPLVLGLFSWMVEIFFRKFL